MVSLCVILLSFLCGAGKAASPDNEAQESSYIGALKLLSRAFPWSEDEILPKNLFSHTGTEFRFPNYTWALGLRGIDFYGRRYLKPFGTSACMASLIKSDLVLTPCSCVFSWYTSYQRFPNNASMFRPHPKRHSNDITAPYLYVHHTIHDGPKYFVDEKVHHYGVRNDPVYNPSCSEKTANDSKELELGVVLLELEISVFINDVPPVMPVSVNSNTPDEIQRFTNISGVWTVTLVTYGTRFKLDNEVIYPDGRDPLIGQRLNLRDELISFRLIMVRGPEKSKTQHCDELNFNFTISGQECWRVYTSLPLCHVLAGSPVVTNDGASMYGLVLNDLRCEHEPHYDTGHIPPGLFELRRFWTDGPNDLLLTDKLLDLYGNAIKKRDQKKEISKEAQSLYNFKSGVINYEDDFQAHSLKQAAEVSSGVRISSFGFAFTVLCRIPTILAK